MLLLARLAVETGGRLTESTNDLTLGVARAQRDLGCRYTVGFYLPDEVEERPRRIVVRVLRDGMRAVHPGLYRFRDAAERREDSVLAAFVDPSLFATGSIRGHVFLLQPHSPKSWDTLIAVSFPVRFDHPGQAVEVDFGAVLANEKNVVAKFNRRVILRPRDPRAVGERRFMFLEPAEVPPGPHELRIVRLHADGAALPGTAILGATLPEVERNDLMLVQPILGRPRTETIVVRGDGPTSRAEREALFPERAAAFDVVAARDSFEPLLVQSVTASEQLMARNKTCLIGQKEIPPATLERFVRSRGTEETQPLPPLPIELEQGDKVSCQDLFELLPVENGVGAYLLDTRIEGGGATGGDQETVPYVLEEGAPPEPRVRPLPGRRPG